VIKNGHNVYGTFLTKPIIIVPLEKEILKTNNFCLIEDTRQLGTYDEMTLFQ
jgi:hypothetical protein